MLSELWPIQNFSARILGSIWTCLNHFAKLKVKGPRWGPGPRAKLLHYREIFTICLEYYPMGVDTVAQHSGPHPPPPKHALKFMWLMSHMTLTHELYDSYE